MIIFILFGVDIFHPDIEINLYLDEKQNINNRGNIPKGKCTSIFMPIENYYICCNRGNALFRMAEWIVYKMKINFIVIGKTNENWLKTGIGEYTRRLKHYIDFTITELPGLKGASSMPMIRLQEEESRMLLKAAESCDRIVLLDERGPEMGSVDFSAFLQKSMNSGVRKMAFVVGGAYGFSDELRAEGFPMISLSRMTFSHQMIRLLFVEQLYRACTILKGEPYHHVG
jgi:23S rRNA (pseudouridine1915-N3)-methyltransferase